MTIGEKIKNLRIKNQISQDEVAKVLNTSRQTVSKWERNYSQPNLDDIKILCELLNVSADYFLKNLPETQATATTAEAGLTEAEKDAVAMVDIKAQAKRQANVKRQAIVLVVFCIAAFVSTLVTVMLGLFAFPHIDGDVVVVMYSVDKIVFFSALFVTLAVCAETIRRIVLFVKHQRKTKTMRKQK